MYDIFLKSTIMVHVIVYCIYRHIRYQTNAMIVQVILHFIGGDVRYQS